MIPWHDKESFKKPVFLPEDLPLLQDKNERYLLKTHRGSFICKDRTELQQAARDNTNENYVFPNWSQTEKMVRPDFTVHIIKYE